MDHPFVTMDGSNCTLTKVFPDGTYEFECFERDIIWGFVTWGIIFLPGLQLYSSLVSWTTNDDNDDGKITSDERAGLCKRIGFLLASLCFPVTMVCFKVI